MIVYIYSRHIHTISLHYIQINLQHSRTATSNLIQLINELNIDLVFVQEPYLINNKLAGIPKKFKTFTYGNDRKRAAVIVNNCEVDVIMINQLSNKDCVVVEVSMRDLRFYAVSKYFDYDENIEQDIVEIESILEYVKGQGLLIAADTNSRSKLWFDTVTNFRGKKLEEFITTSDLNILNEDNETPTFETVRGQSKIDLTISNNALCHFITGWKCGEKESCADHKIISFQLLKHKTGFGITDGQHFTTVRYIIKENDFPKFDSSLKEHITSMFRCKSDGSDLKKLEEELCGKLSSSKDNELVSELYCRNKTIRP